MFEEKKSKEKTVIEAQEKKDVKKIGSMNLKRGHRLFSWNIDTDEALEVIPTKSAVYIANGNATVRRKVMADKKLYYFGALNLKNAKRKIKILNSK